MCIGATTQPKTASEQVRSQRHGNQKRPRYAFASVLWGSSDKAFGLVMVDALVLGHALYRYTTNATEAIDRVLLVTGHLAANPPSQLLSQYWIVRVIEEVK